MSRRPRRKSRTSRALRWLAAGVLAVIALAYVQPLRTYLAARDQVAARRAEVAVLEQQRVALERRLEFSGTDAFIEQEARKFALVRPGERLFIVKGLRSLEKPRLR